MNVRSAARQNRSNLSGTPWVDRGGRAFFPYYIQQETKWDPGVFESTFGRPFPPSSPRFASFFLLHLLGLRALAEGLGPIARGGNTVVKKRHSSPSSSFIPLFFLALPLIRPYIPKPSQPQRRQIPGRARTPRMTE